MRKLFHHKLICNCLFSLSFGYIFALIYTFGKGILGFITGNTMTLVVNFVFGENFYSSGPITTMLAIVCSALGCCLSWLTITVMKEQSFKTKTIVIVTTAVQLLFLLLLCVISIVHDKGWLQALDFEYLSVLAVCIFSIVTGYHYNHLDKQMKKVTFSNHIFTGNIQTIASEMFTIAHNFSHRNFDREATILSLQKIAIIATVWLLFAAGIYIGTLACIYYNFHAVYLPPVIFLLAIIIKSSETEEEIMS